MTLFDCFLCVVFFVSMVLNVRDVGKQREPITPGTAALIVAVNTALILGIVLQW